MFRKLEDKRGEVSSAFVITVIILIVSFVVILIFIFTLDLGKDTDEICHNSLVVASSIPLAQINLNCHTKYFCLSMGDKCAKESSSIKVVQVKDKEEVEKFFADKLAECWSMVGEGNLNYVSKRIPEAAYCGICSNIYLSDKVQKEFKEFKLVDFWKYLINHNVSNKNIDYWHYLYPWQSVGVAMAAYPDISSQTFADTSEWIIITGRGKMGYLSWWTGETVIRPFVMRPTLEEFKKVNCKEYFTQA